MADIADEEEDGFGDIGTARYPATPSLQSLQQMRNRLHTALLGKRLMKWKEVASVRELRYIAQMVDELQMKIYGELHSQAMLELARCRYYQYRFNYMVLEGVDTESEKEPYVLIGLGCGGEQAEKAKKHWKALTKHIVHLAEVRASFQVFLKSYVDANRKKHAMQKVVIPKTLATIVYITRELEEIEREDIYRRKKLKLIKLIEGRKQLEQNNIDKRKKETEEILKTLTKGYGDTVETIDTECRKATAEEKLIDLVPKMNRTILCYRGEIIEITPYSDATMGEIESENRNEQESSLSDMELECEIADKTRYLKVSKDSYRCREKINKSGFYVVQNIICSPLHYCMTMPSDESEEDIEKEIASICGDTIGGDSKDGKNIKKNVSKLRNPNNYSRVGIFSKISTLKLDDDMPSDENPDMLSDRDASGCSNYSHIAKAIPYCYGCMSGKLNNDLAMAHSRASGSQYYYHDESCCRHHKHCPRYANNILQSTDDNSFVCPQCNQMNNPDYSDDSNVFSSSRIDCRRYYAHSKINVPIPYNKDISAYSFSRHRSGHSSRHCYATSKKNSRSKVYQIIPRDILDHVIKRNLTFKVPASVKSVCHNPTHSDKSICHNPTHSFKSICHNPTLSPRCICHSPTHSTKCICHNPTYSTKCICHNSSRSNKDNRTGNYHHHHTRYCTDQQTPCCHRRRIVFSPKRSLQALKSGNQSSQNVECKTMYRSLSNESEETSESACSGWKCSAGMKNLSTRNSSADNTDSNYLSAASQESFENTPFLQHSYCTVYQSAPRKKYSHFPEESKLRVLRADQILAHRALKYEDLAPKSTAKNEERIKKTKHARRDIFIPQGNYSSDEESIECKNELNNKNIEDQVKAKSQTEYTSKRKKTMNRCDCPYEKTMKDIIYLLNPPPVCIHEQKLRDLKEYIRYWTIIDNENASYYSNTSETESAEEVNGKVNLEEENLKRAENFLKCCKTIQTLTTGAKLKKKISNFLRECEEIKLLSNSKAATSKSVTFADDTDSLDLHETIHPNDKQYAEHPDAESHGVTCPIKPCIRKCGSYDSKETDFDHSSYSGLVETSKSAFSVSSSCRSTAVTPGISPILDSEIKLQMRSRLQTTLRKHSSESLIHIPSVLKKYNR